ncbi:MAG: hypothetical protein J6M47_05495 [Clostridia bacterium]|nr:hypothetical protein [Clostridia bacterium]
MLSFKNYDMLFDDRLIDGGQFVEGIRIGMYHYMPDNQKAGKKKVLYEFSFNLYDDRYYTIACDYDNFLYRETVYDIESEQESANPRRPTQNELRQQFFACYDIHTHILYISDSEKKGVLAKYFKGVYNQNVKIRERFASFEDFERTVRYLKSIRFTQSRTLTNTTPQGTFKQRYDPIGLNVPDKVSARLDYGGLDLRERETARKLRELRARKDTKEFDSVVIVGLDAFGVEKSFDFGSMVTSLEIVADADENGRYSADAVIENLLHVLRAEE